MKTSIPQKRPRPTGAIETTAEEARARLKVDENGKQAIIFKDNYAQAQRDLKRM
jgi:hypothetical protein